MTSVSRSLVNLLPKETKASIKLRLRQAGAVLVRMALSYSPADLENRLTKLGLKSGDSIVLHASFSPFNGFEAEIQCLIDCFLDVIGPQGHMFMMSMPYSGAAREYLAEGVPFDVRRTPSRMGMITESFRRRPGVLRSSNPLHPVLAWGPYAKWVIEGHEQLEYSCGKNSPFEKMLELDTKAVLFDVDLDVLSFTHHLEDCFKDSAPVRVYTEQPFPATIIDTAGEQRSISVYPFSWEGMSRRNFTLLYDEFEHSGGVRRDRIGNTSLAVASLRDLKACGEQIVTSGRHIFGPPGNGPRAKPSRTLMKTVAAELSSGRLVGDVGKLARHLLSRPRAAYRYHRLPSSARTESARDRLGLPETDPGPQRVIEAGLNWLRTAQDRSASHDGGIARHFSLVSGWSTSYPETTGYAIPTLLACASADLKCDLRMRAQRMIEWLISIQLADGAFQGGVIAETPLRPVVFNTGQILMGLAAGAEAFNESRYFESLHRAATWLVATQDSDGCWRQHGSPFTSVPEHTYDTHVAWGLLEAARVSGEKKYADAALSNVRWAITHQRPNGWFGRCCLTRATDPLTHTIAYALRGVIEAFRYSGDRVFLDAAHKTASALVGIVKPDGFLAGRLRSNWQPAVTSACLTGSAQTAACMLLLHENTRSEAYVKCARALNRYVRRTIRIEGPIEVRGGVKGSFPIDGDYGTFEYLNWAVKFMIDANLMELETQRS